MGLSLNSKLRRHYNKLGHWIIVDPPRPNNDSVRINLNKIIQEYGINAPNELAKSICNKYDWQVENPRIQRIYDGLVVKEWDDFIGCTHFGIISLAGAV